MFYGCKSVHFVPKRNKPIIVTPVAEMDRDLFDGPKHFESVSQVGPGSALYNAADIDDSPLFHLSLLGLLLLSPLLLSPLHLFVHGASLRRRQTSST